MTEEQIYGDWTESGVAFALAEHDAVFTVEESAKIHDEVPGRHTKNLFLKDTRGGHWLVVLPAERRADLKAMAAVLGAGRFSFVNPDEMMRLLGVAPGSVTPLAALGPSAAEVALVFDASFAGGGQIAVHPLRNTATVSVDFEELRAWMSTRGCPSRIVDLP
jgi:Ala-tRNA(Pro) deacylase